MKRYLLLIITLVSFTSCEEFFDFHNDKKLYFIIIEGLLTNEYKYQTIKLTYSYENLTDTAMGVQGAKVYVSDRKKVYVFMQTDTPGIYISTEKFATVIDRSYTMLVVIGDRQYRATTEVMPVRVPDSIKFKLDSSRGLYTIDYVAPIFDPYESAMYILYLDWSHLPEYQEKPYDSTHAKLYYFTLRTVDVNELFAPTKEPVYFPAGTKVIERKYSLTPFFEQYIRALLSETQWSGSLFDVQHWNLPTNIQGSGVLGYFTACSVIERRYTVGKNY